MNRELHTLAMFDHPDKVMDSMTTAVIVLNRRLRLVFMNTAAEMLFALSFRQAQGSSLDNLATGIAVVVTGIRQCLATGHPYTEHELQLILPGNRLITVDCTVTPMSDQDLPGEVLVEFRQIDRHLRILREENLLAQHNTARQLLRNLAHEIKNPLGGLRGAAQLLERQLPDEALKEYTRVIIGEADRLRNLVDCMLGPTNLPVRTELNIHKVLERVRSLMLAETGGAIPIEPDYDPSIPTLIGDPDQLIQAALNIVRNAVQVLDGKGRILLRTRVQRQVTIGHKRHKLAAQIDIVDNGPGIPEALQEEIFYPMITGRAEGTGLGLSLAQDLVNQHGGIIECRSRPGETTFTLLLPLEKADG